MSETNEISRLAEVIGYPEAVPSGADSFTFVIDDRKIEARLRGGRLIVSCVLSGAAPYLATLAAGRMMREESVLAWDAQKGAVVLWGGIEKAKVRGEGEQRNLKLFFETYLNSLDWWMDRVENADPDSDAAGRRAREMRIIP